MTETTTARTTRAERLAMPLAREVVHDLAVEHGACIRPVQLRRTNLDTGEWSRCSCPAGTPSPRSARRARSGPGRCGPRNAGKAGTSRHEPVIDPDPATEDQRWWIETTRRSPAAPRPGRRGRGQDTGDLDELLTELDDEITNAGMRGKVLPARPARRHRSTRRRQDAPDLPRRKVTNRTVGKTYTAPDGKTFRPSMFVTLTCPSYGRVREDGTPADPASLRLRRGRRGMRWRSRRCLTG